MVAVWQRRSSIQTDEISKGEQFQWLSDTASSRCGFKNYMTAKRETEMAYAVFRVWVGIARSLQQMRPQLRCQGTCATFRLGVGGALCYGVKA